MEKAKNTFKGLFFGFMLAGGVLLGLWVINLKLAIKTDKAIKYLEQVEERTDSIKRINHALEQVNENIIRNIKENQKKRRAYELDKKSF